MRSPARTWVDGFVGDEDSTGKREFKCGDLTHRRSYFVKVVGSRNNLTQDRAADEGQGVGERVAPTPAVCLARPDPRCGGDFGHSQLGVLGWVGIAVSLSKLQAS